MDLLWDGPANAPTVFLLTHGAGAPMDSALLTRVTAGLTALGHRVGRFEFPYMAARRHGGGRRPPDPTDVLLSTWEAAVTAARDSRPIILGGHSMGGRMATMVADRIQPLAVTALAYPWHPPEAPAKTRTQHLAAQKTPTLMVCGTRDTFGSPEEVAGYTLSPAVTVHFVEGADHSFAAKARSGRTARTNLEEAVQVMHTFVSARVGA